MLVGLDDPWSGSVTDWLANYGIHDSSPFDSSLGTVGAGNHFAEICTVERIVDKIAAETLGMKEDSVYLLGANPVPPGFQRF
jgi:release factor H-coupled RctB family protein